MADNLGEQSALNTTTHSDDKPVTMGEMKTLLEGWGLDKLSQEMVGMKSAMTALQLENDATKANVSILSVENDNLRSHLSFLENTVNEVMKKQDHMSNRLVDLHFHQMKQQLVFYGIPLLCEKKHENTKEVIQTFLWTYLKLDTTTYRLVRAHRLNGEGPNIPIVAVFEEGKDTILQNAKLLAAYKTSKFFISTHLPPELAEEKKILHEVFKEAKHHGKTPKYVGGKGNVLKVDGVRHEVPKLPVCKATIPVILSNISKMNIKHSDCLVDEGNRFVAHTGNSTTPQEAAMTVSAIKHYSNNGIARATHNMVAARLLKENGDVMEIVDDDGEYGGAKCILDEMRKANIVNKVIVCTRWFSGVELGRRRFVNIRQCARAVIVKTFRSSPLPTPNPNVAAQSTPVRDADPFSPQPMIPPPSGYVTPASGATGTSPSVQFTFNDPINMNSHMSNEDSSVVMMTEPKHV